MDASHESMLQGRQSPGGPCALSHLDEIGVEIRLRARLTNLANKNMDSAEGDPVPILN